MKELVGAVRKEVGALRRSARCPRRRRGCTHRSRTKRDSGHGHGYFDRLTGSVRLRVTCEDQLLKTLSAALTVLA
jgi:hypothetical protein